LKEKEYISLHPANDKRVVREKGRGVGKYKVLDGEMGRKR
jgi:hypothetical protein